MSFPEGVVDLVVGSDVVFAMRFVELLGVWVCRADFPGMGTGIIKWNPFLEEFPRKILPCSGCFFLMTGKQHFTLPKHYSGKWVTTIFLGQVFIVGLITMDQRWLKNHLHGTTWFCGGCLLKHGSAANWWIFPRTRLGGANKIPWVQFTKIVEIYWTYTFISTKFFIEEHRPI